MDFSKSNYRQDDGKKDLNTLGASLISLDSSSVNSSSGSVYL